MSLMSFLRRETAYTLKVFFSPILGAEMAVAKARQERERARHHEAAKATTGSTNVVAFPTPLKAAPSLSAGITVTSTINRVGTA